MGCNWRIFFDFIKKENVLLKIKSLASKNLILRLNWWNNSKIRIFSKSF